MKKTSKMVRITHHSNVIFIRKSLILCIKGCGITKPDKHQYASIVTILRHGKQEDIYSDETADQLAQRIGFIT